eukprot:tig00021464_g21758.t1
MFEFLAANIESAVKKIGSGKLTKDNVSGALREVRLSLLDADVNLDVVKRFVADVEEKALGTAVVSGVTPEQMFIKVVHDELKKVMGEEMVPLNEAPPGNGPTVILMAGLQGVGKTTATGKLAFYLNKQGKKPFLVAADVYRPAAVEQLKILGKSIDIPVFSLEGANPVEIAKKGIEEATSLGCDTVIIDTAGRLAIDDNLMLELQRIKNAVLPVETLLVVDAMTGQEAAALTKRFDDEIGITGALLTKLDGDSRGGAALSIREVSGKPIKFVGVGEKMDSLQPFYPDRMANRILGMGDIVSLVEKAQELVTVDEAEQNMKKMMDGTFNFNDFMNQMRLVRGMGTVSGVLKMIPGFNKIPADQLRAGETKLKMYESIINAMTKEERVDPDLLLTDKESPQRRRRIASGSGRTEEEVTSMINDFKRMREMMSTMSKRMMQGQGPGGMGNFANPFAPSPEVASEKPKKKVKRGKGF